MIKFKDSRYRTAVLVVPQRPDLREEKIIYSSLTPRRVPNARRLVNAVQTIIQRLPLVRLGSLIYIEFTFGRSVRPGTERILGM